MARIARCGWMPLLFAWVVPAGAQHHGGGGASFASHIATGHHPSHHQGPVMPGGGLGYSSGGGSFFGLGAVGGGYGGYGYGYGVPFANPAPVIFTGPIFLSPSFPTGQGGGGLMLPMPPARFAVSTPARPRRPNPERSKELVEIGDRSFRAANFRRAEERYQLAARADVTDPAPHIHLAQVSVVRKAYGAAAEHIRSAVAASPGPDWLGRVADIQSIFAEPGDFARHVAQLESHLQANPGDRDAWFVLGVEWYLSGRTQQAGDAFQRLTDRAPDEALLAFLEASKARRPAAN